MFRLAEQAGVEPFPEALSEWPVDRLENLEAWQRAKVRAAQWAAGGQAAPAGMAATIGRLPPGSIVGRSE